MIGTTDLINGKVIGIADAGRAVLLRVPTVYLHALKQTSREPSPQWYF